MIMNKSNGMKTLSHLGYLAAGVALSAFVGMASVQAATPADTLVLGWTFDDMITLDPAESFELSTGEILGNTYDRLLRLDPNDAAKVVGDIAESWDVSEDGLTYTFKIREGQKFASGNPLTAEDVAYSLVRAVKIDKSPSFILTQFGFTADNVEEKVKATDANTLVITVDQSYAPSFVLNCLTADVASVVDKKLVEENAKDGDYGYGWLKTNYAGSGPMSIRDWRANEIVVLERNDNYRGDKALLQRVMYRYVKESATQRLMLEKGDIDVARNLEPGDIDAAAKTDGISLTASPKGTVYYFSLNQKNETLAKPEVREALKYLVDYDAIESTLVKHIGVQHQTFLPKGLLGASDEKPYKLDVAKAKELLEKAGLKDGFNISMDVRSSQPVTGIAESIQQTFAQAGVKMEIIPGDGKQTLTKYRARKHDLYIGQWGTDYWDPNTNADTFASNPDNGDDASAKTLAWRNAWDIPELTKETKAAVLERDTEKRTQMYLDLQKKLLDDGPFVVLFQQTEVAAYRNNIENYKLGVTFTTNSVFNVSKK
ncbi:ABC transporter substrate-binding protein [Pseudochrobactrum sp. MP213Fo]|uniref:ABC transporter substrate-binding protein n=1 Tax=Pseudochrobactrum sp. MP213Fo TaxID=3022250 RepID=UPI003B9FAEE4